eukprot:g46689.t1
MRASWVKSLIPCSSFNSPIASWLNGPIFASLVKKDNSCSLVECPKCDLAPPTVLLCPALSVISSVPWNNILESVFSCWPHVTDSESGARVSCSQLHWQPLRRRQHRAPGNQMQIVIFPAPLTFLLLLLVVLKTPCSGNSGKFLLRTQVWGKAEFQCKVGVVGLPTLGRLYPAVRFHGGAVVPEKQGKRCLCLKSPSAQQPPETETKSRISQESGHLHRSKHAISFSDRNPT